jgi:Family of unknown function (DUF5989)
MGFISVTRHRVGIVSELFSFLMNNKRWWLIPIVVMMLLLAVLIILGQSSAIAPFIYTLF